MDKNDLICEDNHVHLKSVAQTRLAMPKDEMLFDLAEFFKVFADSTRIKILCALHECELCVCDIAALLNMTNSAVSHQLKILRQANLVKNRKQGKEVYYTLSDNHVRQIFDLAVEHLEEL